jgi:peptidyl-prolyl cis-trans isomerase SurA
MSKQVFSPVLLVAAALLLPAALSADTVVEEIVARVNNQIITRSAYQHEQQVLTDEAKQQDAAHADQIAAENAKDVLRGLIDRELLLQKGKELDITADSDVIKKLDDMRQLIPVTERRQSRYGEAQGISFEDFNRTCALKSSPKM